MNANLKSDEVPACSDLAAMEMIVPWARIIDKCMLVLHEKSPEDFNRLAREIEQAPGWGAQ
jgi:hypothetical protein